MNILSAIRDINKHIKELDNNKQRYLDKIESLKLLQKKVPDLIYNGSEFYRSKKCVPTHLEVRFNGDHIYLESYAEIKIKNKKYTIWVNYYDTLAEVYKNKKGTHITFRKINYTPLESYMPQIKTKLFKIYEDLGNPPVKGLKFAPPFFQKLYNFT